MSKKSIPNTTIERLPLYYRTLQKVQNKNEEVISSRQLGDMLGIPSTQVRKDLSYYGEFGRRGVGYEVVVLLKHLRKILGLDNNWEMVLVGAGNLGHALVNYNGFKKMDLNIKYVFDVAYQEVSKELNNVEVHPLEDLESLIKERNIKIGIIAVPAQVAQEIADRLIDAGIEAIWNFAPVYLRIPDGVQIKNEDLSTGLISLTYHLSD